MVPPMPLPRFRLRSLLIAVAVAAVVFAGLRILALAFLAWVARNWQLR